MYTCQPRSVPRVTSWFFLNFLFYFFDFFFELFFKMSMCKPSSVPHVKVNILYSIWSHICYFCSIRYQILLTLTNLVPIEDVTKFNFYIKVIMM